MRFVYLTSIGVADEEVLDAVEACLRPTFGFEMRRSPPLPEPEYACDTRSGQYNSSLIVKELFRRCPADAVRFLGITEKDLFIPMLTFVFGQAQLEGTAAVISLARLRQEFYQMPPNRELLKARAVKEARHEMGHTFGLVHCPERACAMSLALNIQQLDLKGSSFCTSCEVSLREKTTMLQRAAATATGREVLR